jgi:uncharacterized protein (DUF342 family)
VDESSQSLSFFVPEDTGELHASFDPTAGAPPDLATVKQRLVAHGFGEYFQDEQALADFVRCCGETGQPLERVIGQRRDGEFKLALADDLMAAYLTLTPPQGGRAAGPAVIDALREAGVVYGIQQDVLDAALAAGHCEQLLIAKGDPPQEGVSAGFECLFAEQAEAAIDEHAVIKLTDINHLLLVHPHDPLMRRQPPVPGKNGINIRNEVVLPQPLDDEQFAAGLQGAAPDPEDPDLLVATLAGQPVAVDHGVKVNPVIDVANVDLETGNISFEGTLNVAGDIRSGMRVKVTGDVMVQGTVEAADITAGGNVVVAGGIIGRTEGRAGTFQALPADTARIRCSGTLQALFAENAHLEAGDSILMGREASHSELMARKRIFIGKPGARGGHLVGGMAQATEQIECAVLGAAAGGKTRVHVGIDPYLEDIILGKRQLVQNKIADLDRVLLLQQYLKQNPQKDKDGVGEKAAKTRLQLLGEIEAMNKELDLLGAQQETVEQARVIVHKAVYFGTEIHIGRLVLQVEDDLGAATFRLQDGEIVIDR